MAKVVVLMTNASGLVARAVAPTTRPIHGLGQVGFGPSLDLTFQRQVEGRGT